MLTFAGAVSSFADPGGNDNGGDGTVSVFEAAAVIIVLLGIPVGLWYLKKRSGKTLTGADAGKPKSDFIDVGNRSVPDEMLTPIT